MKILGLIGYSILLLIGGAIWRGYVLSVMWAWFITTSLHAPSIGVAQAIGLSLVVSGFTYDDKDVAPSPDKEHPFLNATLKVILIPLLFLIFGAIVKQFN